LSPQQVLGRKPTVADDIYALSAGVADGDRIRYAALGIRACPFEMSLELARSADLIAGDINYVFDPRVSLRKLFADGGARRFFLVVDEAHALGVLGPSGRGLCARDAVRPDVLVGTLGKAFGCSGAFASGSAETVQLIANRARSYVFSTAPLPAAAAAATVATDLVEAADARRARGRAQAARGRSGRQAPQEGRRKKGEGGRRRD
jgi:7-keto-8-aminopelargonate synthetase-like enzyme